jgi:hypothetical protein
MNVVVFYIILLQMYKHVRKEKKMIDDCFDALKSINTMEWDARALASTFFSANIYKCTFAMELVQL